MKSRLYTPGPTAVPPETLLELARPVVHHRTPEFREAFASVQEGLKACFRTTNDVYIITGSGTAAFEAGLVSTVGRGQKVLNINCGKFGERWGKQCKTFGIDVTDRELEYGTHVTPEMMADELSSAAYDAVIVTHSETSTATACDMQNVAKVVREKAPDALLMVDGITAIGALPFEMDAWDIDVAVTGSQKALMLPPGLGFVSLSERAWKAAEKVEGQSPFYLNLKAYKKSAADNDTPYTPANTLIHALAVSMKMITDEGLENVWKRTAAHAEAVRAGMTAMGLSLFSKMPADSVTAINYPEGVNDDFRKHMKGSHGMNVAAGQASMKGNLFRVNHMGYTDVYDALAVVAATELVMPKLGFAVEPGVGVAAAQKALANAFA
ncbi:MAG: alanine--glyoxylate aminotransferase family protein [Planctomycetota bacterium]